MQALILAAGTGSRLGKYTKENTKCMLEKAVDKYQAWMDGTAVTLAEDDSILGFYGKKAFRFQDVEEYYKTVNIYKFSKEFSRNTYIPFLEAYSKAMGDNEYYESVLRVVLMLEEQELKALRLNGEKWYEIDDVQDKANAEVIFSKNAKEKLKLIPSLYGGYWRFPELRDFCYLANPYFPTVKMQEEMKAYFYELLSQYPSGQGTQRLLAGKMFKVEAENIIVGNGVAERDRFYNRLKEIPYLEVVYSQANYFLLHVTDKFSASELTEILLDRYELYIKDLTGKIGFDGRECIRIAVKDFNDNEFLIESFKKLEG